MLFCLRYACFHVRYSHQPFTSHALNHFCLWGYLSHRLREELLRKFFQYQKAFWVEGNPDVLARTFNCFILHTPFLSWLLFTRHYCQIVSWNNAFISSARLSFYLQRVFSTCRVVLVLQILGGGCPENAQISLPEFSRLPESVYSSNGAFVLCCFCISTRWSGTYDLRMIICI